MNEKAICLPSGDQVGSLSQMPVSGAAPTALMFFAPVPSAFATKIEPPLS